MVFEGQIQRCQIGQARQRGYIGNLIVPQRQNGEAGKIGYD